MLRDGLSRMRVFQSRVNFTSHSGQELAVQSGNEQWSLPQSQKIMTHPRNVGVQDDDLEDDDLEDLYDVDTTVKS